MMTSCHPKVEATVRRAASAAEWTACRMLVPECFAGGESPEAWVAESAMGAIVGAAGCVARDGAMHRFRVRVIRGWRRRGVGTRLLEAVGDRSIYAPAVDSEGDAEPFLLARGFTRVDRVWLVEGDLLRLRDRIFPLRERLLSRVPAGVSIVRAADVAAEELARLYAEHIVPLQDFHAAYAMPLVTDARFADSPVLCVNGRVEGMVLYEVAGETGTVQGRVVTEQYRGGWANTLLMAAAIDRGLERGVRRLRFEVPESNPDTRKLMARVGAEVLRCTSCFARVAVSP